MIAPPEPDREPRNNSTPATIFRLASEASVVPIAGPATWKAWPKCSWRPTPQGCVCVGAQCNLLTRCGHCSYRKAISLRQHCRAINNSRRKRVGRMWDYLRKGGEGPTVGASAPTVAKWRSRHGSNLGNTRVCPVPSQRIDTLALASHALAWMCYLGPTSQVLYMRLGITYWQLYCCGRTRTASGANTREPCREVAYGAAISRRRASASWCVASSPLDPNSVANSPKPVPGGAVA